MYKSKCFYFMLLSMPLTKDYPFLLFKDSKRNFLQNFKLVVMMETKSDSEKIKKNLVFLKSSTLTL